MEQRKFRLGQWEPSTVDASTSPAVPSNASLYLKVLTTFYSLPPYTLRFPLNLYKSGSKDYGGDGDATDSIAWSVMGPAVETASLENRVPASWLPSSQPQDGKKTKHPIRTDMLLVFSCLAG